ncbi:unnamed protein product [Psylliodes chrysocephalus]|uniref:ATP-dependent DNA helicase n=1 Tax=Psylliodes chrysocephalus TaxID=3402493 RepID=A0A9P0GG40_9CUCU|nr:unnamed protein product [Psylliodes chrysocephala]
MGDGQFPTNDEIKLIDNFKSTGDLVEDVYGTCFANYANWEQEVLHRAILTPLNATSALYNDTVHQRISENKVAYTSIDTVKDQVGEVDFSNEYLRSRNPADLPSHKLKCSYEIYV